MFQSLFSLKNISSTTFNCTACATVSSCVENFLADGGIYFLNTLMLKYDTKKIVSSFSCSVIDVRQFIISQKNTYKNIWKIKKQDYLVATLPLSTPFDNFIF